jgi:hypothetical protein
MPNRARPLPLLALLLACLALTPASVNAFPGGVGPSDSPFLGQSNTVTEVGSTIPPPPTQDLNPYGIVNVRRSVGSLVAGDTLISNFNNSENHQGTGSTLVQITPSGELSVFAQISESSLPEPCPGGVGLTTALTILPNGYVVVGSLPTSNGKAETAQAGCLIVLDSNGHVVQTISGPPINGPWDLTSISFGRDSALFVTNVLNGTVASGETPTDEGTVVRIGLRTGGSGRGENGQGASGQGENGQGESSQGASAPLTVTSEKVIATGFPERTDPEALVVGPTGVGLGFADTLFVADTQGNRIAAIPDALFRQAPLEGGGFTVAAGGDLNNPLGLTIAPNGDILTANAGDGNIVETTPFGRELTAVNTGAGAGGLFGLTVAPNLRDVLFVNDAANALDLLAPEASGCTVEHHGQQDQGQQDQRRRNGATDHAGSGFPEDSPGVLRERDGGARTGCGDA